MVPERVLRHVVEFDDTVDRRGVTGVEKATGEATLTGEAVATE
jgi:hypothetical protein